MGMSKDKFSKVEGVRERERSLIKAAQKFFFSPYFFALFIREIFFGFIHEKKFHQRENFNDLSSEKLSAKFIFFFCEIREKNRKRVGKEKKEKKSRRKRVVSHV